MLNIALICVSNESISIVHKTWLIGLCMCIYINNAVLNAEMNIF